MDVGGTNEGEVKSSSLGNLKVKNQQGTSKSLSHLDGEKLRETELGNNVELEGTTMATPPPPLDPPLGEPIDPFVRSKDPLILVPRDLTALDMPSNLPQFWGTKDEDPSRHMERYIERLASSLITDPGYCLVWFPTTPQGEAYKWYGI